MPDSSKFHVSVLVRCVKSRDVHAGLIKRKRKKFVGVAVTSRVCEIENFDFGRQKYVSSVFTNNVYVFSLKRTTVHGSIYGFAVRFKQSAIISTILACLLLFSLCLSLFFGSFVSFLFFSLF